MMSIVAASKQDIATIRKLAQQFWPVAFTSILSTIQIEYMMEMMYSEQAVEQQMNEGHQYAIAYQNSEQVGYVSYETDHDVTKKTKVHKLYVSPNHQREGLGKAMLEYVVDRAIESKNNAVFLNVNKYNTQAINFYKKSGFFLSKAETIDIGEGFVMDDFVFELPVNTSSK